MPNPKPSFIATKAAAERRLPKPTPKAGRGTKAIVPIELDPLVVAAMLAVGMGDDRQSRSRRAIGEAIEETLQDWAARVLQEENSN